MDIIGIPISLSDAPVFGGVVPDAAYIRNVGGGGQATELISASVGIPPVCAP